VKALDTLLLYVVLIGIAFWVLVLRPVRRQRAQRVQVASRLEPGARVLLSSGLLARVVAIEEGELVLDAGEGVLLRYVSGAVRTVLSEGNSAAGPDVPDKET
jgi:preprotein translocase subunit YajC